MSAPTVCFGVHAKALARAGTVWRCTRCGDEWCVRCGWPVRAGTCRCGQPTLEAA